MCLSPSLNLKALQKDVHNALRAWNSLDGKPGDLLEDLLLVRECRAYLAQVQTPIILRQATNQVLAEGLKKLKTQNETGAKILENRFRDHQTGLQVAFRLNLSRVQMNRQQRTAIKELTQILWHQEMTEREAQIRIMEGHLPTKTYERLFGFEAACQQLVATLIQSESPWIVAIVGMGGIGKTALADAVVRQVIHHFCFEQVIWLRAGHQHLNEGGHVPVLTVESLMSALANLLALAEAPLATQAKQIQQTLTTRPHLIIIDNLEVEADAAYLLTRIMGLTQPSKFLLTTRTALAGETAVFMYPLDGLSKKDAAALLQDYAQAIGVTQLAQESEKNLQSVYETVGGNPLAIKLVAHLIRNKLPLSQIPANLNDEQLYQRIYQKTWVTLSRSARSLLLAMILVSASGALPEQIQAMSGLPKPKLWMAIRELRTQSLLEGWGTLHQQRYGIHQLTETYLRTEVIYKHSGDQEMLPAAPFVDIVSANLVYWQNQVSQHNPQLNTEHLNIIRAVHFGLEYTQTWATAINLIQQAFPIVERQGYWHEWAALLQQILIGWTHSDLTLQGQLLIYLGHLYRLGQQTSLAIEAHQKAYGLAEQIEDNYLSAQVQFQLSEDYYQIRDFDQAGKAGQFALTIFRQWYENKLSNQETATLNRLGLIAWKMGDLNLAQKRLQQASDMWRALNEPTQLARTLQNLAIVLEEMKKQDEALTCYQEAGQLFTRVDSKLDLARLQLSLGTLYFNQGNLPEAEAAFEQARTLLQNREAFAFYQARAANNLGHVFLKQKLFVQAKAALQEAVSLWQKVGNDVSQANSLGALGQTFVELGQMQSAKDVCRKAQKLLHDYPKDVYAQHVRQEISEMCNQIG